MVHRDVKPSNVVIQDRDDLSTVKLVDFGLSIQLQTRNELLDDTCGTLVYQAPEQLFRHQYNKFIDLWAVGIIMYEVISGKHPLYHRGQSKHDYVESLRNMK